jgi:hypothetical protein
MALETGSLDAPIPGMSLTHELGARPWQSPPQYVTLEEALDFYLPKLTDPALAARALEIVEKNIPLTAIAETLTVGGVMQGLHSVDVAVLLNPIIVELLEIMAKSAGVDYILGDAASDEAPDPELIRQAVASVRDIDKEELKEEIETLDEQTEEPSKGLMARRGDI